MSAMENLFFEIKSHEDKTKIQEVFALAHQVAQEGKKTEGVLYILIC